MRNRKNGRWELVGTLGPWGLLRSQLYDDQKYYYNVATAASITGFVRAYLWRHLHAVRKSGGTLLYTDTDSIAYSGSLDPFTVGPELGQWGIEKTDTKCSNFIRAGIAGKKLYAFEAEDGSYKTASKGVRLKPAEIMDVARGMKVKYESIIPTFSPNRPPYFVTRMAAATHR